MSDHTAYVDTQQRALEFEVGDLAYPLMAGKHDVAGRVVAVYPSLGMVDVEWPNGSGRYPVEELQRYQGAPVPPKVENTSVPGGKRNADDRSLRIARAYVKKSLYWAAKNRHYKATQSEVDSGAFRCPKCKEGVLRAATYKRREGCSEKLLGCPECLFLVKKCDILGHPDYIDDAAAAEAANQPFARLRLAGKGL